MYLDRDGNVVKGLSSKGHLAYGVPGNVAGFELALAKYGTMKRAAVSRLPSALRGLRGAGRRRHAGW
jgi:gamma-glutamyltranspeptidase/glutathione hydrolase